MTAIVPLTGGNQLPAYLANREAHADINSEVVSGGPSFPVLSIKGKVFTLVKNNERKVLTRPDDPDEVLQFINLSVVRANTKSRVFYAKSYVEGSEEVQKPDCYSQDGVAPAADARTPQAKKCQICKHAVWGSKVSTDGTASKGTACTVNTRLAVADPDNLLSEKPEPYLLRVPAGSRANFADVVKAADARGIPYNALILKVGFDKEAPSPKLTFKLIGLASDAAYAAINALRDDDTVKAICGLAPVEAHQPEAEPAQSEVDADLDAALAAKAAAAAPAAAKPTKAPAPAPVSMDDLDAALPPAPKAPRARPAPKAPPAEAPAPAPAAAPTPAPAAEGGADELLAGLDALLGNLDD